MSKFQKKFLVGYTGFVGSNLNEQFKFDKGFDSKNIKEAYNERPDLLVYAGVPAQKFIANSNPDADFEVIKGAINNISNIMPKKIILISTIDVYGNPVDVDEDFNITENEEAYGRNRRYLETWVQNNCQDYLIVRLPALYGKNLKKNFIYDLIHFVPNLLKNEKFLELSESNPEIKNYYINQNDGFYKCKELNTSERNQLKNIFENLGFSALNFTDSRAKFQFYNLKFLWKHIQLALENNIKVLNLATEPISVYELYNYIYNNEFKNELKSNILNYNFKTKHYNLFNGENGYILNKQFILEDIKEFIFANSIDENKLCISNIAWQKEYDSEMYELLKNKSIKNLEIAPTRLLGDNPYDHIEEAKKLTHSIKEKYDINIVSMQSIWYGKTEKMFGCENNRKELLQYTKKAINFASAIECHNIVFGNPKNRNMSDYNKNYDEAIEFFRELGEYAELKNVVVSIEPNPTIYNTNFLNKTIEAIEFVKEVNSPYIKVNCDLGTIIENKENLKVVDENIKYINHIHISEPNLEIIKRREIHKELLEILRKNDYNKSISVEMKQSDIKDIEETINYVKNVYWSIYGK